MAILSRYISTAKAAGLLGVSTTQVKILVDKRKLHAWKTQGGHRRIALDSIESYLSSFQRAAQAPEPGSAAASAANAAQFEQARQAPATGQAAPRIAVSIQTPGLLQALHSSMDRMLGSSSPGMTRLYDSPAQALREVDTTRPNILLLEMSGSVPEQQDVLRLLSNLSDLEPSGPPIAVLLLSQQTALNLPPLAAGRCLVHIFNVPVSVEWVNGCLAGMLSLLTSMQWGSGAFAPRQARAAKRAGQ